MSKIALYFGYGDGGHFLRSKGREWESTLRPERKCPSFPWSIGHLDSGLLANRRVSDRPDGRVHWTHGGRPIFWHAFFWWDRSGDTRPGSNSGLYVRGFDMGDEAAAFSYALAKWPGVVQRQKYDLRLVGLNGEVTA